MALNGTRSKLCVSVVITVLGVGLFFPAVRTSAEQPAETAPVPTEPPDATPVASKTADAAPAAGETPPPPAKEPAPVEAKPAEAKESAPSQPEDGDATAGDQPPPDFSKLAEPAIAEWLQLTDQQRAQVTTLLTERTTSVVAAADEAAKAKALEESDRKLAAVLTAEQLAEFKAQRAEPRLRFQFRFERWADVLQWFAEQADLSLVLDAPPPGTFNYSDTREYTPTEAIDLLNGVLLTKGYTLVRRGRMLLVLNLKDGVPEGVVPKVELDELDKRGKFELVTMAFPLGRRPAATVSSEISPLLSPHGKVVPLPATAQLLVTDTAGIMRAIGAVIESIAEPPAVPAAAKPEPPVAAVYPIKPADPKSAVEVLTAMVPEAKIVLDEKADQIHVHAPPSQQALVREVLEQMQAGHAPEKQPRLETYPVAETGAEGLLETLQTVVPEARLTLDSNSGKLVAWAVPADQKTIEETIEKLEGERSPARIPQFEVYRLTKVEPDAALNLLKNILPDARLAIDAQTRMLIAVAVPADQEVIRRTLSQLQPEKPAANIPELRYYPLALTLTPDSITALKKTVPRATIALEANGDRLMVVATPEEHEQIKATIGQIETAAFAKLRSKLIVYVVTLAQRKRFMAVLSSLQNRLPGIRVIEDAEPGELSVWAKPQQHEVLAEILTELKRDIPNTEKFELVTYPIRSADAANVLSVLQEMFPDTKLVLDEQSGRVLAWTRPAEHASIKAALEKIDAAAPTEKRPRFEIYRLRGGDATELLASLGALVPGARLTVDPKTGNLIAWATPEEQDMLEAALGKLQRGGAGGPLEDAPQLEVYRLTKADPTSTRALLQEVLPDAKLSIDAQTSRLIALAVPEDHRVIQAMLDQLQPEQPDPNAPELRFYPLSQTPPDSLITVLSNAAPQAQITLEPGGKHLTVLASPADHEVIRKIVDRVEETAPLEEKSKLVIYPVTPAQRKRFEAVQATLTSDLPGIKVIGDAEPGELAIWAKPTQHVVITQIMEELKRDAPTGQKYQLVAYQIKSADPASVMSVLETLFPGTQIVLDEKTKRLAVWARPEQHAAIRAAIDQLDSDVSGQTQERIMVYPIRDADPEVAIGILQELLPDVKFQSDVTAGTIVATGRQKDQERIKQVLEQLQVKSSPEKRPRLEVYPLEGPEAAGIVTTLQPMVPEAQLSVDPTGTKLVAWGTPEEHETLKTAIEKMGHGGPLAGARQVEVYRLTKADPQTTLTLLQTLLPGAKLSADPQTRNLVAVATLAEHRTIRGTLEQLQPAIPGPDAPQLVAYQIKTADPESVLTVMQDLFPDASLVLDKKTRRLVVRARPEEHEAIRSALEQMDSGAAGDALEKLMVYPIPDADPGVAMEMLQELVPDAKISSDATAGTIVAWARQSDHQRIQRIVEQMQAEPAGQKPTVEVYTIQSATAADAMTFLATAVPNAKLSVGSDPHQLIAWARPADHEAIKAAVEKLSQQEAAKVGVYTLETSSRYGAYYAVRLLRDAVPGASFAIGSEPSQLIAWARPKDHELIKGVIEQMSEKPPPEKAPKLVVYTLKQKTAADAETVLEDIVPNAELTVDAGNPQKLNAWATPPDHEMIESVLAQIDVAEPPDAVSSVKVYTLETTSRYGGYYAMRLLREAVPGATFTTGSDPGQLIAWARPKDHEMIEALIEQMTEKLPPEKAPKLVVYTLQEKTAAEAMAILENAVDDAEFTVDANPQKLNAWATPRDHQTIQSIIAQIDVAEPPESASSVVVYTLESAGAAGAAGAIPFLQTVVPEAKFTAGSDRRQLIAWARPAEHEKINGAIEQLSKKEPPETAPRAAVYTLESSTATQSIYAIRMLREAVPGATFTLGTDPSQLIVWARPKDHEVIQELVDQMAEKAPPEKAPKLVVYTLNQRTAADAVQVLQTAVPDARLTVDADPQKLSAWARPRDHQTIQEIITQIDVAEPADSAQTMQVYTLKSTTAARALSLLTSAFPGARFTAGSDPRQLIAWARPADHGKIKAAMEQMSTEEPTSKVYRFRNADPKAALSVLAALVPGAEIALDTSNRSLVVSALPDDHQKIQATIDEMDREDAEGAPKLQIHRVASADLPNLLGVLQALFQADPEVQLSLDENNDAVIAVASPADHQKIRDLIKEVEAAGIDTKLELYPLKNVDSYSAIDVLQTVLEKQGAKVELSIDSGTNQLVAIARPEEHELIRSTLEQLRTEERELEIFQLDFVEPATAELAITNLFRDEGLGNTPGVDSDPETQQLFIRGTKEQLEEIRKLLVKLGETGLTSLRSGGNDRLRVIQFPGDAKAALTEIQRIWPQLRQNPIRVVTPSAVAPLLRNSTAPVEQPQQSPPKEPAGDETPPATSEAKPETETPAAPGAQGEAGEPGEAGPQGAAESPADSDRKQPPEKPEPEKEAERSGDKKDQQPEPVPPVLVVLGDGSITIASEDPAALDQFESLLRTMMQRTGYSGRDFSIFTIRNASAGRVADTLTQLFRTTQSTRYSSYGSSRRNAGRIVIVPDERLNTILVKGGRADRAKIEDLLKILDTAEDSRSMKIIPLRKTNATRMQQVLDMILEDNVRLRRSSRR